MAEPDDTRRLFAIPRAMVAVVAIAAAWMAARQRHRPARGTVVLDGAGFTIDGCKKLPAAAPASLGVDLRAGDRDVLRLVQNDSGTQLFVYSGGSGAAIPVDQRDCSQWDIHFSSAAADPLTPVEGSVTVTCTTDGRKIDGTAWFDRCPE